MGRRCFAFPANPARFQECLAVLLEKLVRYDDVGEGRFPSGKDIRGEILLTFFDCLYSYTIICTSNDTTYHIWHRCVRSANGAFFIPVISVGGCISSSSASRSTLFSRVFGSVFASATLGTSFSFSLVARRATCLSSIASFKSPFVAYQLVNPPIQYGRTCLYDCEDPQNSPRL